jgi:hypothetical protein
MAGFTMRMFSLDPSPSRSYVKELPILLAHVPPFAAPKAALGGTPSTPAVKGSPIRWGRVRWGWGRLWLGRRWEARALKG